MIETKKIQEYLDFKYPQNKGFFVFGSQVYGSVNNTSDIDLVVIDDSMDKDSDNTGPYDIQFVSEHRFLSELYQCDIRSLEGIFGPYRHFKFKVDLNQIFWNQLRSSISEKSSHSFVKAKKKLKVANEIKSGQKSMFHSLRILDFGIQLANKKIITDFSSSNHFLVDILQYDSWEELEKVYKPIYNKLHSEFKLACPKSF